MGFMRRNRSEGRIAEIFTVSWRYLPLEWGILPRKNAKGAEVKKAMARRWMAKNEQRVAPLETVEAVENG